MNKRISSRKLAEKYFEDHGREFYKQSEIAAFLAGWAARGKADQEIVLEYDNQGSLTEVYNGIGTLDEQD